MAVYDFEYDGQRLSDYGYIIGGYDSNSVETNDAGSRIAFNLVSTFGGSHFKMTHSEYEECLEATFQIVKNPCYDEDMYITLFEFRQLMVWLNRKHFHKLKLIDDKDFYNNIYFEASFNVNKVEVGGDIRGAELEAVTNRPFALREPSIIEMSGTTSNWEYLFMDISDDEGMSYPYTEITLASSGDLTIRNDLTEHSTVIKNCTSGEVITMDYPIITSSLASHASTLQNDFNWRFFNIGNTFTEKQNNLTVSLPCTIRLSYSPAVKLAL